MLIKCPKCRSVYDLPDKLMPAEGLKMRCVECGEIWVGHKRDALKAPQAPSKDIRQLFESAAQPAAELFKEETNIRVVQVPQVKHTLNLALLTLSIAIILITLFVARYDIVRLMPGAEHFYNALSLQSIPLAQNLEFKDIATREFVEDNVSKLEISGKIVNTGSSLTLVPPVKIDISDKDGKPLVQKFYQPTITRLEGGYDILFQTVLDNPSPQKKSIYLTFHDHLSGEN